MKKNNSVLTILNAYLDYKKYEKENCNDVNVRLKFDDDAKYYYEVVGLSKEQSLYADTIVSFWTIYKSLITNEVDSSGNRKYKFGEIRKDIDTLDYLIKKINNNEEVITKVNKRIECFADICYTKGNFMLLPERSMNNERYKVSQDRIDMTLYECFEGGKLSKYFDDDSLLKEWITENNLEYMFNGEIAKENINWFIKNEFKRSVFTDMYDVNKIYEYLDNAVCLIRERNAIKSYSILKNVSSQIDIITNEL